jgi:hypothetical protein
MFDTGVFGALNRENSRPIVAKNLEAGKEGFNEWIFAR